MRTFVWILLPAALLCAAEPNWPQWRGPGATGISEMESLPATWNATQNVAWKVDVPGRGHSQPVVWGNRLFLTTDIEGDVVPGAAAPKHFDEGKEFLHPDSMSANREHTLKVLCFDTATGKLLWEQTAYQGKVFDNRHKKNTYASPTPATDGKAVFAYFESMGVYAYDFQGKQLWKASVGNIGTMGMGPGASPVLTGGLLILQCDEDEGKNSFLYALSAKDGSVVWKKPRPIQVSWSTPLVVNGELITTGFEAIIAYDPKTGAELWKAPGLHSNAVNSPVPGDGLVIATAGYPEKRTFALKLTGDGDHVLWKYEKGTAYVPSPILYRDHLYLMTDRGLVTCLNPKTGQPFYEGKRVPVPATFTASPVAFDGKIFLTSEDGDTYVIKAGPEHEVLATNSIGEPVYASLALAGDSIYIRAEKHLYRIRKQN